MIKINGEMVPADGMTVKQYLEENKYSMKRIVVEKNGEILEKDCYETTILKEGDVLEVVSFVGGG